MKNLIFLFVCIAVIPTLLGGCTQTPQQPEFDDPLFQRMYSQMKTYSDERERTIANLLDGNCEEAYAGLKLDPQYPQEDLYRWAELHRTGLCADQNHELAFLYYQQAIEQNPDDSQSLAGLSAAYWRGVARGQYRTIQMQLTTRAGLSLKERLLLSTIFIVTLT